MLSLKTALTNIANWIKGVDDYVIDQGTKDGWVYRRWKSDILEMWSSGSKNGNVQSWNGGYGITFNISAPFYTKNGRVYFTAKAGTGFGMPVSSSQWNAANKDIAIATWGSQSDTVNYNVYVIGTWSE